MAEPAVDALRRHAVERSERKRRAVAHAIHHVQDQGEPVSVSAVARAAGVSREFIHSHPDLHQAVRAAARHAGTAIRAVGPAKSGAGLRAERSTLLAQIDKHRATIKTLRALVADLEDQRRRWLGSQLADLTVDPDAHAALRRDNDRLTSQNRSLQQELDAARRTSAQLERELAASRRAHAEHVAELAADPRVSALTGHGES
jgi:hypothetical protein